MSNELRRPSGGINAKQVDEGELSAFWNFNLDDCKNEVVVVSEFLIIVEKINDLDKARLIKIITLYSSNSEIDEVDW